MRLSLTTLVIFLLYSTITSDTRDWPMFQHDPQHSGLSTSDMPESLHCLWKFERPDCSSAHVVTKKGKVIALLSPSYALSLDIIDGNVQWETSAHPMGLPAADEDRIYIGVLEGILCLDTDTGELQWQYYEEDVYFKLTLVVGNSIIVNTEVPLFLDGPQVPPDFHEKGRRIICLDAGTGETTWEFYGKHAVNAPACYHDRVYVASEEVVYCLDAKVSSLIWEREIEMEGASYVALSQDGKRVFVVHRGGLVTCLSSNGEILWQFDCGSSIENAPAVGYGRIFFGSEDDTFYCLDARKGNLLWKEEIKYMNCPLVVAGGKVAVGAGKTLYILNVWSGKIVETYEVEDYLTSIALSDGKLIVGEENGTILCLGSSEKNSFYQILMTCIGAVISIAVIVFYAKKKAHR